MGVLDYDDKENYRLTITLKTGDRLQIDLSGVKHVLKSQLFSHFRRWIVIPSAGHSNDIFIRKREITALAVSKVPENAEPKPTPIVPMHEAIRILTGKNKQ